MKKLLLILTLLLALSTQNFALNTIEKTDVVTLGKDDKTVVSQYKNLDETNAATEVQSIEESGSNATCETCCTNCTVITINCHCGASFRAQYCEGGCCPHPPLAGWVLDLCDQACKNYI